MNITNYREHPGDNRYMIFHFRQEEHADHFQSLLEERNVIYERHFDDESDPPRILFGISKRFNRDSLRSNHLTYAKYRSPMITNVFLKYLLLVVTFGAVLLALIGYFLGK